MNSRKTLVISIIATSLITALVFSYLVNKNTIKALVEKFSEVETFNEVGRVEIWSNIQELLEKGCNKEALLYVKYEKSSVLSSLKNQGLLNISEERRSKILKLIKNNKRKGFFRVPSC